MAYIRSSPTLRLRSRRSPRELLFLHSSLRIRHLLRSPLRTAGSLQYLHTIVSTRTSVRIYSTDNLFTAFSFCVSLESHVVIRVQWSKILLGQVSNPFLGPMAN
jgi:hypothetical protein